MDLQYIIQHIDAYDAAFVLSVIVFNLLIVRFGMWPYSIVTLPGTTAHELCHYTIARLLFARPSLPSLWPKREGDQWVLGSVGFVPTIFNSIPIALAPFLLLPVGIYFISEFMHPALGWTYFIYGWIGGNLLFASLPSSQDWKIAAPPILIFSGIGGALYLFLH